MQPSHSSVRSAALLATSVLAIAVTFLLPLDRRATRQPPTAVAAAADVARAPVTVTLYQGTMDWRTAPWLFVSAVVTHVEGLRVAGRSGEVGHDGRGSGRARADGQVTVRLRDGTGLRFLPFDTVTVFTGSFTVARIGGPMTFTVPELRVDVAPDRTAIEGIAAPGAAVRLVLDAPPGDPPGGLPATTSTTVVAGPTGRFRWTLGDGIRLAHGQGGWATIGDGAGNTFRARFAAFQLRLGLDRATGAGWLTPANDLDVLYPTLRSNGRMLPTRFTAGVKDANGRRRYSGASNIPLTAGSACTVTVQSPLLGTRSRVAVAPSVTIFLATADRVEGTAQAGVALALEVFAADDDTDRGADVDAAPIARLTTTVRPEGRWRVDLPPTAPLPAGGRIEAVLDLGDGLEVAAAAIRPRFTVAVGAGRIVADVPSKERFRFTVRAPDGTVIGRTRALGADATDRLIADLSPDGGMWDADLHLPLGELTTLLRGGSIEVDDFGGGEPILLPIPPLAATSDATADVFAGTAPPGAALAVEVIGAFGARWFDVTADAAGAWSVPLAGQIDVRVGVGARAWYTSGTGHRFYVDTAPVRIVAEPESRHLDVAPATGRPLRAEILDHAGRHVATVTTAADGGSDEVDRRWGLTTTVGSWLVDRQGGEPAMKAGDTIRARVGDDEAEWVLPPFEAGLDPDRRLVVGRTAPGTRLEIIAGEIDDPLTVTTTVTADAAGNFSAELDGRVDVMSMGGVYVRGAFGPHVLQSFVYAPNLDLDIDHAEVTGVLEPNVAVEARLMDGDVVRATGRGNTGIRGHFRIELRDGAGAAVIAQAGNLLVVEDAAARLFGRMELIVPPLTIAVDPIRRTVFGDRPDEGQLSVFNGEAHDEWPVGGASNGVSVTEVRNEPGRWTAFLNGGVVPGDTFHVAVFLDNRYVVRRSITLPILAVEHGGQQVCGFGQPFSDASLDLLGADGESRASVAGGLSVDGSFTSRWADDAGRPVTSRAGDRVVGRVGEADIEIALDVFTATLDLAAGTLRSRVRPETGAALTSPSRDCLFRLTPDDERWLDAHGLQWVSERASAKREPPGEGQVVVNLPDAPHAERGFDLHVASLTRHRIFRTVYHALTLQAEIATGHIAGHTRPYADVHLTVRGPDGGAGTELALAADSTGAFAAAAVDAAGRPIALAPGDRVSAAASVAGDVDGIGVETATMTVEEIFVGATADAISGRAPAGRTVAVRLDFAARSPLWMDFTADANGSFGLRPDDIPPRAGWALADVTAVRAELAQDGGHRTVFRWLGGASVWEPLFLPWGEAGVR